MIEVKKIEKSYGKIEVLKSVNLAIKQGEIIAIVGPSGAGKSTLLQIVGTLSKSDGGRVLIDGVDVQTLNDVQLSAFRREKIGFVFQFHNLLPEFNAIENVMLPALIAGSNRKEANRRAAELLEMFGLKDRSTHKPSELSGGEQQRVAIARALMNRPKVILADEPTGNLDTKNRDQIIKILFDIRKKFGTTILFVTHDMELAELSDRTIRMKDGKILPPTKV